MISKALKAHSFYHTARYVCQKPGAEVLIAEGVRGHDFRLMADDFVNQQQMRPGKEKAGAHFILSFHPDEKPPDVLIKVLTQEYLSRLGITNTQVAVVKHTDKKHLHLHILANMVNNDGEAIPDNWIGLRGKKIAQELTREYKLIPAVSKSFKQNHTASPKEEEATKNQIYLAISDCLNRARSMADLEKLLLQGGIETKYKFKGQTDEKQGISFKKGKYCFKGSEIDRKYSLAGLHKTLASQQGQRKEIFAQKAAKLRRIHISPRGRAALARAASSVPVPYHSHRQFNTGLAKLISILLRPVATSGGGSSAYSPPKRKKKRKPSGL